MLKNWLVAAVAVVALAVPALAQDHKEKDNKKGSTPDAVKKAVEKAYPGAKIDGCKEEKEDGKVQYEVKIETKEKQKLELDVAEDGKILLVEEPISVEKVPAAVMDAFKKKYPGATAKKANKQTKPADSSVHYEIAAEGKVDGKDKKFEATFSEKGEFEGEE